MENQEFINLLICNWSFDREKPPQISVHKMDDGYIRSLSAGNSSRE